jgi:NAD-dependent deacetylase
MVLRRHDANATSARSSLASNWDSVSASYVASVTPVVGLILTKDMESILTEDRWGPTNEPPLRYRARVQVTTPDQARQRVDDAHRVVVLTGAGISTASGIPDFRGPQGVWTKDPHAEMLANYETWVTNVDVRRAAWRSRAERRHEQPEPNDGHRSLLVLEQRGVLDLLVTQNIDGLHQRAGSSPERIVEIHGSSHETVCLKCGHRQSIELTYPRILVGDDDPACLEIIGTVLCGGMMKSAVISFGQSLNELDLTRSERAAAACDLLLAVGSTLAVFPAASLVPLAKSHGAVIVIVNGEATRMDDLADFTIAGDINVTLPALLAR